MEKRNGGQIKVSILLFLFLELGEVFVQFGLNLLHALVGIFGGRVQLFLQEAQADVSLAELLSLETSTTSSAFFLALGLLLKPVNESFASP